ncbi:MAG: phasin family protein [Rhodomicrobium sp.]
MTAIKLPEMPQAVRELAAKNLDQAQAVCTQLLDGARKAQETMKTMTPAIPMLEGLSGVQERALKFAEQNIDAGFSLAKELSQAADLTEMLQIQNKHVQQLLHSFSAQTQELIPTAK